MEMVRAELGATKADEYLPLTKGGVTLLKLRGAMHDTCNTANLVAKKVAVMRDDAGKDIYGEEEWQRMQQHGHGWQDFLCANHSRNLHFDAFSRSFRDYIKVLFGNSLSVAKERSGGRLRIEPDGESFVRSICKLTHVGPKQYEKGKASPRIIPSLHACKAYTPTKHPSFNPTVQVMAFNLGIFYVSTSLT
jgi:hypothetical protein